MDRLITLRPTIAGHLQRGMIERSRGFGHGSRFRGLARRLLAALETGFIFRCWGVMNNVGTRRGPRFRLLATCLQTTRIVDRLLTVRGCYPFNGRLREMVSQRDGHAPAGLRKFEGDD